jgi:LuxR family maltose regulon positive regulatory protein
MIETKVRAPAARAGLLRRPRLVEAVQAAIGQAPLVLVTGMAGVGKTTLVSQWMAAVQPSTPVAWLTLDPRDNDPARFWRYVRTALAVARPQLAQDVTGVVSDSMTDAVAEADAEALADELVGVGPVVLVLDDLHFIVEPTVLSQLDRFVGSLVDDVRVVMLCRTRPPLRLARRAAAGQLVELHGTDLMFTIEETGLVLGGGTVPAAAPDTVRSVQDATGGWPIAVALSAQLGGDSGWALAQAGPATAARARRKVADYLTEEVLRALGPELTAFLLETSILDEMTVSACNAVRDAQDSARLIGVLELHDALLTPVGSPEAAAEQVWRHHAVVRDHLRLQLATHDPVRWTIGHERAARHYAPIDLERAVAHAIAAGAEDLAADLLERVVDRDAGRIVEPSERLRLLEALPDPVIGARPKLRDAAIVLALALGRPDLTVRWIRSRRVDDADGLETLLAELWRTQGVGDQRRMLEMCQLAVQQLAPGSPLWAPVQYGLMAAASSLGDWTSATAAGRSALVDLADTPPEAMPFQEGARSILTMTYARAGRIVDAIRALGELDAWLSAATALGYVPHGYRERVGAVVAYFRGDLRTAGAWDSRETALIAGLPFFEVESLLDLVRVRRAVGDTERARALATELRALVSRMADSGLFGTWLATEEEALGLAAPGLPARLPGPRAAPVDPRLVQPLSGREVEVLRMLRSEFSMPEIASHLYVSYNTVKTHTRTIYRKLDVNGRSAAVARGRQLGYL